MQRIKQLDSVRGLAVLAVFFHHAFNLKLLWMGVDLFFILSGFLITGVLLNAKQHSLGSYFARFYSRRARRIMVPYLVLLVLASLFFGVAWMQHWYFYILLTNFLSPLNIPHPVAFDPLWSLAVEEQFYLVWPFAIYFLSERRVRHLSIFLILLAPVLRGGFHFQQHWAIYMLTPFRMDLLAVGSLLCIEWRANRERIERLGGRVGLVMGAVGIGAFLLLGQLGFSTYGNTRVGNVFIYEASLFACVGFMLYALSGRGVGWLNWSPMRYIGQISYTMYLVHLGILTLVLGRFPGYAGVAISLCLTIAYSALSWSLMEKHLLGRSNSIQKPRLEPA